MLHHTGECKVPRGTDFIYNINNKKATLERMETKLERGRK